MGTDMVDFIKAVAERFGIDIEDRDTCDHAKGIVYVTTTRGQKIPLAYSDEACTEPHIFDCSHDALRAVIEALPRLMMSYVIYSLERDDVREPTPEMFSFVRTEDKAADVEITDLSAANAVIAKVKA